MTVVAFIVVELVDPTCRTFTPVFSFCGLMLEQQYTYIQTERSVFFYVMLFSDLLWPIKRL